MASSLSTSLFDRSDKDLETVAVHVEYIQNVAPKTRIGARRPMRSLPSALKVSRKGKEHHEVWGHFTRFVGNGVERSKCNYCRRDFCVDSSRGTSAMLNHLRRCRKYPPNIDQQHKRKDEASDESSVCDDE